MKLHISNWLSFSLFFFLIFSCKKKDDFLPLKTGKYQIEQTAIDQNGNINVFNYIAYGPKRMKGDYNFDIKLTDSTNFCRASFYASEQTLLGIDLITCLSGLSTSYKITYYDCSEDNLTIYYKANPYSDSTSGTVIFNLLEE
ncbi:hypothetical protein [Fluviicola taffensis]|nr:hypothetical protein [Fluviicola taffensis]